MAASEHDLVVIGGGPGGYVGAIRASQLGLKVACVEEAPALGGTCLRIGCIPSKALLESSALFSIATDTLALHGINTAKPTLDLATMLQRKDKIVSMLTRGVDSLFKKHKIARIAGHGRLDGPHRVVVENNEGQTQLTAKHILLATGSKPATLPGVALDGDRIGTSTEALSYTMVPNHLVVIGAGYIGVELGSVWRRLGAKVAILEFLDRILAGIDTEIAREAQRLFEKQGLEFNLNKRVAAARTDGDQCVIECEGAEPIRCDRVLVAVGRRPNTEKLGLESVNITIDDKGWIPVNDQYATSAEGVYAIGDVIRGPMLAHKAQEEAIACVERIVTGYGHVNYDTIPSIVYTHPEIASVGKTEDELKQAGIAFRKGVFPFRANGRALTLGDTDGRIKILADAQTDRVLGVHILGPRAGDLIAEVATAMNFAVSSEDIARCCHAHPTLSEAIREAALAVDERSIHS